MSRVERSSLRSFVVVNSGNQSRRLMPGRRALQGATTHDRRRSGSRPTTPVAATTRARSVADSRGTSTASIDHDRDRDRHVPGPLRREFRQRYGSCVVFGRCRSTTFCRRSVGNVRSRNHIRRRSSGCRTSSRTCSTCAAAAGRVQSTALMIRWTAADRGPHPTMKYSSTRRRRKDDERRTTSSPTNSCSATHRTRDVTDPKSTQC